MHKFIPLILFTVFTNFGSQILMKRGMTEVSQAQPTFQNIAATLWAAALNVFVISGLALMVVSLGSHLLVLSKVELSYAYPFLGLSFVLTALWGYFLLGEPFNAYRFAGVIFIVAGVALVARS